MSEHNFWNEQEQRFRRQTKNGRVITLRGTTHFFFQEPDDVEAVVREIHEFCFGNSRWPRPWKNRLHPGRHRTMRLLVSRPVLIVATGPILALHCGKPAVSDMVAPS
jgi:hypothetical protein